MTQRPIINPQPLPRAPSRNLLTQPVVIAFVGRSDTVARAVDYLSDGTQYADQPSNMHKMRTTYGLPLAQLSKVCLDMNRHARALVCAVVRDTSTLADDAGQVMREALARIASSALADDVAVQAVMQRAQGRDVYITGIDTVAEARRLRDVAGALVVYVVSAEDTHGPTHDKPNKHDRSEAEGRFDETSPFVTCEFNEDELPRHEDGSIDWASRRDGWPFWYDDVVDVVLTGDDWVNDAGYINALARSGAFFDLAASTGAVAAPLAALAARRRG
jgi:hypothetical protein